MVLEARDIALAFADAAGHRFPVLDVPSFAPKPGAVTVIGGPSGSGKSTLLYVLAGIQAPDRGQVLADGRNILALGERQRDLWRRRHVGFVFQDFHLVPELSPLGNVLLPATFGPSGGGVRERAAGLLAKLGVPASRRTIEELSRGERQRVAVARALLFDPPVILADEPSASLDRDATAEIRRIFRRLAGDGRTVIVASHDPELLSDATSRFTLAHGVLMPGPAAAT